MHTLIIAIIGIALAASALYSGLNYINFSSYEEKIFETVVVNDMYSYEMALNSHNNMYNYYPETAKLEEELNKVNAILPSNASGNYEYLNDSSTNSVGICYTLSAEKKDMVMVEKIFDKGGFIRSADCFSKINNVVDDGINYPSKISITKWIKF